jgi:hypothetical protein
LEAFRVLKTKETTRLFLRVQQQQHSQQPVVSVRSEKKNYPLCLCEHKAHKLAGYTLSYILFSLVMVEFHRQSGLVVKKS